MNSVAYILGHYTEFLLYSDNIKKLKMPETHIQDDQRISKNGTHVNRKDATAWFHTLST